MIRGYSGNQPGDPEHAAAAIVQTVELEHPPLRLLLGKMALETAATKLAAMNREIDVWVPVVLAADDPDVPS